MKNHKTQRGLSLIELMVALAIGSVLIIGAVTVYVQSRKTYSVNETAARLQENARYALSMIEPDIRLANHWGLMSDALMITGTVGNSPLLVGGGAADCGANFPIDLRKPVEGENGTYTLGCPANGGSAAGTDTLVIRRAGTETVAATSSKLQVYTTRQGGTSRLFNADAAPGPVTVDPLYGPNADVRDLIVRAYYISPSSSLGANVPSLRRKNLVAGPGIQDEEIMPGVEDLQIQFGIDPGADANGDGVPDDNDGNGVPDFYNGVPTRYVNANDPILASSVVIAVRLWLRVRSENFEVGFTDSKTYNYADVVNFTPADNFRRLLVSRTIQIRNNQT